MASVCLFFWGGGRLPRCAAAWHHNSLVARLVIQIAKLSLYMLTQTRTHVGAPMVSAYDYGSVLLPQHPIVRQPMCVRPKHGYQHALCHHTINHNKLIICSKRSHIEYDWQTFVYATRRGERSIEMRVKCLLVWLLRCVKHSLVASSSTIVVAYSTTCTPAPPRMLWFTHMLRMLLCVRVSRCVSATHCVIH